jgi:hypothetical protein
MLQLRTWESLSGADHGWLKAKHHFAVDARLSRGVERTEFKFRGGRLRTWCAACQRSVPLPPMAPENTTSRVPHSGECHFPIRGIVDLVLSAHVSACVWSWTSRASRE